MKLYKRITQTMVISVIISLLFSGGCLFNTDSEPEATLNHFSAEEKDEIQYISYDNDKHHISFQYPEYWTLEEKDSENEEELYVTLKYRKEDGKTDSARIIISLIREEIITPEKVSRDLVNTLGEVKIMNDGPSDIDGKKAHLFEAVTLSAEALKVKCFVLEEQGNTVIMNYLALEDEFLNHEKDFLKIMTTLNLKR